MRTIAAIEFGVPGWDGSRKRKKGGHPFRISIRREDRGARVKRALAKLDELAERLGFSPAFIVLPGTSFASADEVRRSGIRKRTAPVLYETPNPNWTPRGREPRDQVHLHDPLRGRVDWLQRVVGAKSAHVNNDSGFRDHELVTLMLNEMPSRLCRTEAGTVFPMICGEVGVVPMHRDGAHGAHQVAWPRLHGPETKAMKPLLEIWRAADVIVNPSHTTMARYNDVRRQALSRSGKLVIAVANVAQESKATSLRVYVDGGEREKRPMMVKEEQLERSEFRSMRKRGSIFGVEARDGESFTRFWFVRA